MTRSWFACSAWAFGAFVVLLPPGCSKDSTGRACVDDDSACGVACNTSHPCATGLYCADDGLCAKECTSEVGCAANQACSAGRCVRASSSAGRGGSAAASGAGGRAGQSGSSGQGGPMVLDAGVTGGRGGSSSAGTSGDTCQMADVQAQRVIPTVVLVIDQSGSMNQSFSGGTRWNVLRDFLLASDGLIATFETQVRFGLALYSAEGSRPQSECPLVTSVAPVIMNFAAITTAYRAASPLGETPTGDAIDKIVASLPGTLVDQDNEPVVLILATDGEPDRCEELNPQNGQAEAVAAVKNAYDQGIRTYIISVGNEVSMQHQQDVANAGLGRDAANNAPYWQAGDDASLRTALTEIITEQVSCDVALQGMVQGGDPCEGTVTLNGTALECNGNDGWMLADPSHIRLMGKACDDFKSLRSAMVRARFPCSVDIVF